MESLLVAEELLKIKKEVQKSGKRKNQSSLLLSLQIPPANTTMHL